MLKRELKKMFKNKEGFFYEKRLSKIMNKNKTRLVNTGFIEKIQFKNNILFIELDRLNNLEKITLNNIKKIEKINNNSIKFIYKDNHFSIIILKNYKIKRSV